MNEHKNGKAQGKDDQPFFFEHVTTWIGSVASLVFHTLVFIASFLAGLFRIADWNTILLVMTTIVSLEAIYLSIFIQMSVNRHAEELEDVTEDIGEIQEDVGEIQKDIDEVQEDVEDIQEDVKEMTEEEAADEERHTRQIVSLEQLTKDVQRVLQDLEAFKKQ